MMSLNLKVGSMMSDKSDRPVMLIKKGRKYDTKTALLVCKVAEYEDQFNLMEVELYRNRFGVFFTVRRDYPFLDNIGDLLEPISDKEAYDFMERYCQDQIEDYFGPIAEAGSCISNGLEMSETKMALRLPQFLIEECKKISKEKNLSLNTWLVRTIKNAVDSDERRRISRFQNRIDDICQKLNQCSHEAGNGEKFIAKLKSIEDEWKIEISGAISLGLDEENKPDFDYLYDLEVTSSTLLGAYNEFKSLAFQHIEDLSRN